MAIQDTGIHGGYPFRPNRYNFTDIRTMQIFDPVVTHSKTDIGTSWVQLYPSGATLENGVRIKNTYLADRLIAVTTTNCPTTITATISLSPTRNIFIFIFTITMRANIH